eukprot:scaffold202424_cov14-Tisochrysis_lutea.AAC.1
MDERAWLVAKVACRHGAKPNTGSEVTAATVGKGPSTAASFSSRFIETTADGGFARRPAVRTRWGPKKYRGRKWIGVHKGGRVGQAKQ